MFEEFVSLYRDNKGFVHIYYFPGIGEDGKAITMPLDLSNITRKYKFTKKSDNAIDYIFEDKNIHQVTTRLVNQKTGNTTIRTIKLNE